MLDGKISSIPDELVGCLPNLFFIGGKRCGSTTIHNMLAQHPEIYGTPSKEPNFFIAESMRLGRSPLLSDMNLDQYVHSGRYRTANNYRTLFDGRTSERLILESSHYLYHPDVIAIIKAWQPNARVIVSLRNPADRAFSDYLFDIRDGRINYSFEDYIRNNGNAKIKGRQAELLRPWMEEFGPDRLFLIWFDKLRQDPALTIRRTFDWLLIDSDINLDKLHSQKSGVPKNRALMDILTLHHPSFASVKKLVPKTTRNKMRQKIFAALLDRPKMEGEIRGEILSWYEDDINDLMQLTGVDLSAWLEDRST